MDKKKIAALAGMFCLTQAAAVVAGQYAGGAVFLKLAHLDKGLLSIDTLYQYASAYKDDKAVFKLASVGMAIAGLVSLVPVAFAGVVALGLRQKEELHGSAKFASDMELAKSGLFPKKQVIGNQKYPEILLGKMGKGRFKGHYLCFAGQQFVYLAAPTRSGKGVGIVIPNLLNYRDSVVVLDIKLENFFYSGGYRQSVGQEVFLFSPDGYALTDEARQRGELRSHRWNPLTYIRREAIYRDGDIMNIGKILFPTTGDKNDVWNELASNLFKGLVLWMLDTEKSGLPVTMSRLLTLTAPEGGLSKWMQAEIDDAKKQGVPLSDGCVAEFNRFMAAPDETKGSILSNLTSPLGVFTSAACAAATSGDDFDLRDVRKKRMSIYIGISPNSMGTYSKLINLFFSQLISENTAVLPEQDPSLKYQCLLILDEFTSMGRVNIIQQSIAYTAGYNLRYLLIYQSKAQLEDPKLYGKEGTKALLDNCAVQVFYPPKKVDNDAEEVSKTLGYKTVKSTSKSRTRGKSTSSGNSISDQKRALMLPQEVVDLGRKEHKGVALHELIMMEKVRPFIANKIIYFDEPAFLERQQYANANRVDVPLLALNTQSARSEKQRADIPSLKHEGAGA